jgi:hypothetical protein
MIGGLAIRVPLATRRMGPAWRTPIAPPRIKMAGTVPALTLALAAVGAGASKGDEGARSPARSPAPIDVGSTWSEMPRLTLAGRTSDHADNVNPVSRLIDGSDTLFPGQLTPTFAYLPPALPVARDARANGPSTRSATVQRATADQSTTTSPSSGFSGGAASVTNSASAGSQSAGSDLDELARQVLTVVKKRLAVERERIGPGRGLRHW